MNLLNVSFVLGHLRQMNFCSFVEKNRRDPQNQKKDSCWVVGGQLSNIYEMTVFSTEKIYLT